MIVHCVTCNVELERTEKQLQASTRSVCSSRCAAISARLCREYRHVTIDCPICGNTFRRDPGELLRWKYVTCGAACNEVARRNGHIARGPSVEGRLSWNYGTSWPKQKRLARKRDNDTCQDCGVTRGNYGRALDVHHIVRLHDFDGDTDSANRLENLRTLCKKCHKRADAKLNRENPRKREAKPDLARATVILEQQSRQQEAVRAHLAYNNAKRQRQIERHTIGRRRKNRVMRTTPTRKFISMAELVCLFAQQWKVTTDQGKFEGTSVRSLDNALHDANTVRGPRKSRGLYKATDRCQANSICRVNAEIEADCWRVTLAEGDSPDPRTWAELLASGDNTRIKFVERTHYLDWTNCDPADCVVTGKKGQRATKREWYV